MNPELTAAYEAAMEPFLQPDSAIEASHLRMRSWRYFVEINSGCNLRCPTCARGNKEGYDQKVGVMPPELLEQVLDKIRNENNQAIVFLYGNSEPFLHPDLPGCIRAVKSRGSRCEFSSNLNFIRNPEDTFRAEPDLIIISVSGWTQEIYSRGHAGGDIEKVKTNMRLLAEARKTVNASTRIVVNYHLYKDNGEEAGPMKQYAESLGLDFVTCIARAISMENVLQYLRQHEPGGPTEYERQPAWPDYNQLLPPASEKWNQTMDRLIINPREALDMFAKFRLHSVCPVGDAFTYVRHDGLVSMCACVDDRRLNFGNFLEKSQEELSAMRRGHPICKQCLKFRMNLYFHIADQTQWNQKKPNV